MIGAVYIFLLSREISGSAKRIPVLINTLRSLRM